MLMRRKCAGKQKSKIKNRKSEIGFVLGGLDRPLLAGWLFLIRPARGYKIIKIGFPLNTCGNDTTEEEGKHEINQELGKTQGKNRQ